MAGQGTEVFGPNVGLPTRFFTAGDRRSAAVSSSTITTAHCRSQPEAADLRVPGERQGHADQALEGEIGRQGAVEDAGLDRGREEGQRRAVAQKAFGLALAPGNVGERHSLAQKCGPAMGLGESANEGGVRRRAERAGDEPCLDAAATAAEGRLEGQEVRVKGRGRDRQVGGEYLGVEADREMIAGNAAVVDQPGEGPVPGGADPGDEGFGRGRHTAGAPAGSGAARSAWRSAASSRCWARLSATSVSNGRAGGRQPVGSVPLAISRCET